MAPVARSFMASMPMMKTMPEIWPISKSRLLDVPSGAGWVISAAYWKPIGPALSRKNPKTKPDRRSSP